MSLPWVRLDSNIASHDKVLRLLAMPNGAKAFVLYTCALGYCGGHATDGRVEPYALPMLHGTPKLAQMLVEVRLWAYDPGGGGAYYMPNWAERQELAMVTEAKRAAQRLGGLKGSCVKNHGPGCGCWKQHSTP
jgi:hypothetical protein